MIINDNYGNKTSCRPIRSVIRAPAARSSDFVITCMIIQTKLDSTQSYYHYLSIISALA